MSDLRRRPAQRIECACGGWHRSWPAVGRCRWPRAIWIIGRGPWASVSYCPPGLTAMLFESREEAAKALAAIDADACGGRCRRAHRLVDLAEDAS